MSDFDEKKTNNTPEMTPFIVQAKKDLEALEENHQRRLFFKDTVQRLITALQEAIAEAQSDGYDNLLYLHYRTMRTGLQGRSSVDGAWAIYNARLETIDQGALDLKRRPKTSELDQENETLKASNANLRALLDQGKIQHAEAMAKLEKHHQEVLGKLPTNQSNEDIGKLVKTEVARLMKEKEDQAQKANQEREALITSLQETIKEQAVSIAALEAKKKAKPEENQEIKRRRRSSSHFYQSV